MDEIAKPSNGEPFTCEELIRSELAGKVAASGAYDAILWKIRTDMSLFCTALIM